MKPNIVHLFILAFAIMIASCGPNDKTTESATEPPLIPPPSETIITTDEPFSLLAPATGLAFWEHPTVPFQGRVIAATSEGLISKTLEGEEAPVIQSGIDALGAAIVYFPPESIRPEQAADAEQRLPPGANVQGVFLTIDKSVNAIRLFRIDNISAQLNEDLVSLPLPSQPTGFCATTVQRDDSNTVLSILTLPDLTMHEVTFGRNLTDGEKTISKNTIQKPQSLGVVVDCTVAPRDHQFVVLNQNGDIYQLTDGRIENTPLLNTDIQNPTHIAVTANTRPEGDTDQSAQSQILVLSQDDAEIHLFDHATSKPLGTITLDTYEGTQATVNATTMATGSGNFGGLYRFGVIALASVADDNGNPAAVRVSPLNAAARMLEFPLSGPYLARLAYDAPERETTPVEFSITPPSPDSLTQKSEPH